MPLFLSLYKNSYFDEWEMGCLTPPHVIEERIEQLSLVLWVRSESQRHQLKGCSGSEILTLPDHDTFPVKPQLMGMGEVDVTYKDGWKLVCLAYSADFILIYMSS